MGSGDGSEYSARAADGRLLWRHATGGAVFSDPTLSRVDGGQRSVNHTARRPTPRITCPLYNLHIVAREAPQLITAHVWCGCVVCQAVDGLDGRESLLSQRFDGRSHLATALRTRRTRRLRVCALA